MLNHTLINFFMKLFKDNMVKTCQIKIVDRNNRPLTFKNDDNKCFEVKYMLSSVLWRKI